MSSLTCRRLKDGKKHFLIALWGNVAIFLLLQLVYYPMYETNDDLGIMSLVNGAKGVYDIHLVHINVLFGIILRELYSHWQSVPWYAILQYLLLLCAFVAITYVLLERLE